MENINNNNNLGDKMTKEKKLTAWTVRMTKDWWYYADVMAEDEADALKAKLEDEGAEVEIK